MNNKFHGWEFLDSGLTDLNMLLGKGFAKPSLNLVVGRPSMGVSSLLRNFSWHISNNHKVLFISNQSSVEEIEMSFICQESGLNSRALRAPESLYENEIEIYKKSKEELKAKSLKIVSGYLDIYEIESLIEEILPDVVFFDGLVSLKLKNTSNLDEDFNLAFRVLNGLKLKHKMAIFVSQTLDKSLESDSAWMNWPRIKFISGSSYLASISDVILSLYREAYYDPLTEKENLALLIVQKNRFGPKGIANAFFDFGSTKFGNWVEI